jgi:predicted AlkP superfamily pyrophosphatase or phosphodiesterase
MTTRGRTWFVALLGVVSLAVSCSSTGDGGEDGSASARQEGTTSAPSATTTSPSELLDAQCAGKSRHVLLLGIDGLRSDALQAAETPNIDAISSNGVTTMNAFAGGALGTETEQPTLSGPGWATVLTGVWTNRHGVTDNEFGGLNIEEFPHFFQRIREVEPDTRLSSFVHWIPLRILGANGDVDEIGDDRRVTDLAADELATEDPSVVFIHLDDIDGAGHSSEYTPDEPTYVSAIETVDGLVGELSGAISQRPTRDEECWATIVVTDHGGKANMHGGQTPEERTIPLIIGGDGIATSVVEDGPGHSVVPSTVLAYLGLAIDPEWGWEGEPFGVPPG